MDAAKPRNPIIALEGKYLLTDEGVRYCTRNRIPLRDLHLHGGRIGTGFVWKQFNAPFVQKLISNRLLGSIDIDRSELLSKRPELVDTTKLLVYGILYKKFRPSLQSLLLTADGIQRALQRSPTRTPTDLRFPDAQVQAFLNSDPDAIERLKQKILVAPLARIDSDASLGKDDQVERRNIARKYLDTIDTHTWYLYHLIDRSTGIAGIAHKTDELLLSFVEKAKIADYLSFMLMELVQMVEATHLEAVAQRHSMGRTRPGVAAKLAANPEIKSRLSKTAEARGELINLHFKFDTNPTSIHKRQRLLITVTTSGLITWRSQEELQAKKKTDVREIPLSVFYRQTGSDPEANLGLFYLSYLEEACSKENARFDANVFPNERHDQTVTTILLDI